MLTPSRLLPPALLIFLAVQSANAAPPQPVLLARDRTEPVIAVNPNNPSVILAASNTNYDAPIGNTYPPALFVSHNGGNTFTYRPAPILSPYTTGADPSVAIAGSGTMFFTYLGETPSYCSQGHSAVLLTRSFDSGGSFRTPVIVDTNNADDKPTMRVRSVANGRAHVFVGWTRWYAHGSAIWFARSTNGGASFSPARLLYTTHANAFGAVPVILPGRRVVVFWSSANNVSMMSEPRTRIMESISTDEGAHFGPARAVTGPFLALPQLTQPGSLRVILSPAATADSHGNLYVAWSAAHAESANRAAQANILVMRSSDGGNHWSRPLRINDVRTGDRFMPALTVLKDGSLGVVFYDRRDGWNQLGVYAADVTFSSSADASRNVRINATSTPIGSILYIKPGSTCFAPGRFFGDYIGAAAGPGRSIDVTWADTALHGANRTDVWYADEPLPQPVARRMSGGAGDSNHSSRELATMPTARR